ncbi:MAG: thiamine pyrophosphate-dependent enzyme [Mycoplasmatales bacterium]
MKAQSKVFKSGNEMAAISAAHINFHYMGFYPISPSTEIAQNLDMMKVNGEHDIAMFAADGEHPSAGMMYGAAATGARVLNATSANGLAFMLEQLPVVSGSRMPMVLNIVNRAISAPLNIHCDHSDLYLTLNLGWVTLMASNAQAVYDQNIIALKVAEHKDVLLPAFVSYDGYITSHQKHNNEIFENKEDVREFIGKKELIPNKYINDLDNPVTVGGHQADDFINNRYQLNEALNNALQAYKDEAKAYGDLTGRYYETIESHGVEDATTGLFIMNSAFETSREAIDTLNKDNKVKVIKPNLIRPFPSEDLLEQIKGLDTLIIAERADTPGSEQSYLAADILNIINQNNLDIKVQNVIYGLGGAEVFANDIVELVSEVISNGVTSSKKYIGVTKGLEGKQLVDRTINIDRSNYKVGGFEYNFNEETQKLEVKTPSLRNLMKKPKRITGGHSACAGCGIFPGIETFLKGIEGDVVIVNQTGCAYVVSANYPYSAHKSNYMHNLFQNGASTLSGMVEGILEMKRRNELEFDDDATFLMITGDGGMDIGMGSAIGAALRNHNMIILEYDNEGYMNTGAQLSYTTPIGHRTSTSNVGSHSVGKLFDHKDSVQIMAATNIPYVFTGIEAFPQDLVKKAAKAQWYAKNHGMVYGKILITCPLNWKSKEEEGSVLLESAVNSNFFPLYEIENGITKITHNPEEKEIQVHPSEWLKYMGKSKHLLQPENEEILKHFKEVIDYRWERLKAMDESPVL